MRIYRMALVVGTFSLAWGGDLHQKGLNVLVVDQTGVPNAMLRTASLTAQAIFKKAGIQMEWLTCAAGSQKHCDQNNNVAYPNLFIILPPKPSKDREYRSLGLRESRGLGVALLATGQRTGDVAHVFFDRVENAACRSHGISEHFDSAVRCSVRRGPTSRQRNGSRDWTPVGPHAQPPRVNERRLDRVGPEASLQRHAAAQRKRSTRASSCGRGTARERGDSARQRTLVITFDSGGMLARCRGGSRREVSGPGSGINGVAAWMLATAPRGRLPAVAQQFQAERYEHISEVTRAARPAAVRTSLQDFCNRLRRTSSVNVVMPTRI